MRSVQAVGVGSAGRGDDVGILRRKFALPRFCGLPQFVIDDAQFGNFGGVHLSRGLRRETRLPVAGSLT